MHTLYPEFLASLDKGDKEKSVQFAVSRLYENQIDVVTLYNEILTQSLYAPLCKPERQAICIWEEHVRTSIIRTIIECCYPRVIKEREEKYHSPPGGKTIVLCPPGELHEIGARMVADFFTLCGFDTVFAGANTPQDDIINAIKFTQPVYVAISVTNYYNLVVAQKVINRLLPLRKEFNFRIILGGQACQSNLQVCRQMNADLLLNSFEDIRQLSGGKTDAAI